MKKILLLVFLVALLCDNKSLAQDVLLSFNNSTEWWNDSWEVKCYKGGEAPDVKWFEADYNDSIWDNRKGPFSKGDFSGSTLWLRRHFVVNDTPKYLFGDFYLWYDCDGVAYLNGKKICEWSGYDPNKWHIYEVDKSAMETIHKGDNVLAIRATDNGGDAFISFGLYGLYEPRNYTGLHEAADSLQRRLNEDISNAMPRTVAEATELLARVNTAMECFMYDNSEAEKMTKMINSIISRLNYQCIDISVSVPGSMGDSILAKVENFSDVMSLKLSGVLNNADITTIQSRLTNMREIDMTDVKMESLPNRLFYQHYSLQKVFLPKNLVTIGEYAFFQCYGINYIEFPTTLTTIKSYGFAECDNLQEVVLPEGFTTIGDRAFRSCDNNKYVKLPSTLKSINDDAFYYNKKLTSIEFSEGLTHIYNNAFGECDLRALRFPSTLYYIGIYAFGYSKSLTNIEFNEGLYQIADNAFYECDGLTEVTLPSSLVLANASPFDYCDNLRRVTCLSIEPPYMTDQIPLGVNMEGRELYVPALSLNVYKQTSGWDKFPTIKPIDYLPENITILGNVKLTLPETIPNNYKPNLSLITKQKGGADYYSGSLTVNGLGTLSMASYSYQWNYNMQYDNANRTQNHCSLVNNSHLRADSVFTFAVVPNDIWVFLSLPYDVNLTDIIPMYGGTTNWVIRKYDGLKRANGDINNTWVKVKNDEMVKAEEGFIIRSSRYVGNDWQANSKFQFVAVNNANKNNIFRTTDATITLNEYESEFAHNRSWNLIGNPYPCYYDTRFMDFEAPITIWNMRNSTYTAYSPVDDSYILCPGEAFFVQCPIGKSNIVFNKDGRQTNRDVRTIEAASRRAANVSPRTIVNLSLSDGNNVDHTRIVLNENATLQYEMDKDASKFMSTDATVPQLFTTTEGVNYAINERPFADGKVNLCAYIGTEGIYTIALANDMNGYNIVLEDKRENKQVILTSDNSYTFFLEAGTYTSRFVLHFVNEAYGIEDVRSNASDDAAVYSVEGIKMANPTRKGIYIQNGKKIMLNK